MNNLELYEKVRSVPQEAQKPFSNGRFSGTDINPMWRIKVLTEQFGAAGIGWYYEVISERAETHGDVTMAIVDINLYVKDGGEWSKPIYGTGGNILLRKDYASDEGYKMALTDALGVACKALGIGADVYFEKDVTKYTDPQRQPKTRCEVCGAEIVEYISPVDGRTVTVEQHAKGSMKRFKRVLCLDCIEKLPSLIPKNDQDKGE